MNRQRNNSGFSLVEFVIVTVILTILSILTTASVHHLRESNRNSKRVSDIIEIQTALEMYYRSEHKYPPLVDPGQPLELAGTIFLHQVPSNPEPRNDGDCLGDDYVYEKSADSQSYTLTFCISARSGNVGPGDGVAVPEEIISCIPNCVRACDSPYQGSDLDKVSNGCNGFCDEDLVITCIPPMVCIDDHCI